MKKIYGKDFSEVCERATKYANKFVPASLERAEAFIQRAGWGGSIFGIEHVSCAGIELAYINTGDTYSLTVGQEENDLVFTTSWGDWYQEVENEHCEENGLIRCGYCSEFTPVDEDEWSNTICESCGNNVAGN